MRDRMPVAIQRSEGIRPELFEIDDLREEERQAVLDAISACKQSTNTEFHAGVAAISEDGDKVVRHNAPAEANQGQQGHAEVLALRDLYLRSPLEPAPRKRRSLKLLALAGTYPNQELVRSDEKYGPGTTDDQIDCGRICGRCLKYISDVTGNFQSSVDTQGNTVPGPDPTILIYTATGQVMRTSLRYLHPMPHKIKQIDLGQFEASTAPPKDSGK